MSKLLSDLFPANGGSSLREMKSISLAPLDSFCILLSVVVKKVSRGQRNWELYSREKTISWKHDLQG